MSVPEFRPDVRLHRPEAPRGRRTGRRSPRLWVCLVALGISLPGGVQAQAHRVFANLAAVLEASGSALDRVVKTTVFVKDIADFAAVNEVYAEAFGDHRPARSLVQAAALPLGALVEIEAVAVVSGP